MFLKWNVSSARFYCTFWFNSYKLNHDNGACCVTLDSISFAGDKFPWRHVLTHPPGPVLTVRSVQVERWSARQEPANMTQVHIWPRLAGSSQLCVVCRFFPLPTCGAREFTLWGDILPSCMPVTRNTRKKKTEKKRDSPPVKGTTTWNSGAAKGPWNQNTEHKKTKKNPGHVWKPLARACVSRYHTVLISSSRTLWGNIFLPAIPKQSE